MLISIHPENPEQRKIQQVANILEEGGVIIYPTDTVYGLGCDIANKQAVEKICRIRQLDPAKAMLTFICKDISQIAEYAWQMDDPIFKLLKKNLPGPFTFILKSSNAVPKLLKNKKRTIGVRIPKNNIVSDLIAALNRPLLSISLKNNNEDEYLTDPQLIYDRFGKLVDAVVDGGEGGLTPSALIDCTVNPYEIIREGEGEIIL
jgi:tRNA threonylcarbamoyl adenosine modification protein (Sua5/YciO/YrdC/YwlC family)